MFRTVRSVGFALLLVLSVSAISYGDAKGPQVQGGRNLLQTAIDPAVASQSGIQAGESPVSANRNLTFAPSTPVRATVVVTTGGPSFADTDRVVATPEPVSLLLMGSGLVAVAAFVRKRRL